MEVYLQAEDNTDNGKADWALWLLMIENI